MEKNSRILVVGDNDVIENPLTAYLQKSGYSEVVSSSSIRLNVFDQNKVIRFFKKESPEFVFLGSTRSGGIEANQKFPAEFIHANMSSQNHVVHAAYKYGTKKLLFVGSSCVYPKESPQPIKEEYLLSGPLEPTSEAYAVAKIAGIKLCQAYQRQYGFPAIVMIPATIYGPDVAVDLKTAHVMGALIAKFVDAVKKNQRDVVVWGSGKSRREFLFAEDFGEAAVFLMNKYDEPEVINAGFGSDVSIEELAELISRESGFKGQIVFDKTKPDGVQQKLLDSQRMRKLGWKPKVNLKTGIARTCQWYAQKAKTPDKRPETSAKF